MEAGVEKLGSDDLDDLVELEKKCFAYHWTKEQFLLGLEKKVFVILGVRIDGQLVGYIAFSLIQDEMEILNLAVHPDFRNRKLATGLMDRAFVECRNNGIAKSFLDVKASNKPAILLYEKYGYVKVGVRRKYYPDTKEDAILYRRDFA